MEKSSVWGCTIVETHGRASLHAMPMNDPCTIPILKGCHITDAGVNLRHGYFLIISHPSGILFSPDSFGSSLGQMNVPLGATSESQMWVSERFFP